ncbi:hypothetical protein NQ314_016688 [Rhamnusium bicolor]|uniref:MADF domain-containing protein n=1 Tax=Rhamnusium bicolor TaxID=1586634 RepID=A0AAV8WV12_9CUCU|nr:hypothetical protein NQ314_016688 [Rhamnusium bicolor]
MEWTNEMTLEFIQAYEKCPVLWDPKNPQHKNRNILNYSRLKIEKELEISVAALKKKSRLCQHIEH